LGEKFAFINQRNRGSTIWVGSNRTVHVINGNSVPITVKIDDGESITVQPSKHKAVTLAEGKHQVELVSPDAGIAPETFQLSSSFWTRLFQSPAFVLDPTRTSMVTWEETIYSDNPKDEGDFKVEIGELMTQYSDVDYIFERFPNQLKVDDRTSSVTKTRVSFEPIPPTYLVTMDLDPAKRMRMAEALVGLEPTSEQNWSIYQMVAEASGKSDQALARMESHLDDKPTNVELHRAYHETFKTSGGDEKKLNERYQKYLQDAPDDPDMLYLNGRLAGNITGSTDLFNQAIAKDPEHVFALNGLAYNQLGAGNFKEAKKILQKMIKLAPDNEQYRERYITSLFATKDYKKLEPLIESLPESFRKARQKATLLKLTGKERRYKNLLSKYESSKAPESVENFRLLEIHWSYLNNDLNAYEKKIDKLDESLTKDFYQFQLDLEQDKTVNLEIFESLPSQYLDQAMPLIAVSKNRNGDKSEAKKTWDEFLDKLDARGEHAFVKLARLAEKETVSVDEFRDLSLEPGQKRSWGLALLEFSKFADDEDWKAEILKMNYQRSFPHNFVKRMLK